MIAPLEIRRIALSFDAPVLGVVVAPHGVVFALGDGSLRHVAEAEARFEGHDGVSLALALAGEDVLSAGDDGRLIAVGSDRAPRVVLDFGGRWINAVAAAQESGLIAVAVGRRIHVFDRRYVEVAAFDHPSTVAGLAFDPRGKKVVAAHYNGVSVWMAASPTASRRAFDWKGSHVAALWSPCGRFIVTAMQESAIHGWRLEDGADFRMDGYPTRVRSFAFVDRGKALATTGAGPEILLWPFVGSKGPMGRSADVASADSAASALVVAARPGTNEFAAGYDDGSVRLFAHGGGEGYAMQSDGEGAAVSALAWSADGKLLAFGRTDGGAGVLSASPPASQP